MGAGFSGQLGKESISKTGATSSQQPAGLGDLPECCVALVLSRLDPSDICRLASLNRTFRQASLADTVWESKLPQNHEILAKKLFSEITGTALTKKELYARLCRPNHFGADTKEVWMEKNRGGICVAISWKELKITGIKDRRYWNHISTDESRFNTIAYLQQIWWLEVEGNLEFEFPAGIYNLFFRLQLGRPSTRLGRRVCKNEHVHGWDKKPVQFQLSLLNGQRVTSQYYLKEAGKWIYYYVGDFVVDNTGTPTTLKFSMTQIDCTHSKGGLCLDSVFIYPSN